MVRNKDKQGSARVLVYAAGKRAGISTWLYCTFTSKIGLYEYQVYLFPIFGIWENFWVYLGGIQHVTLAYSDKETGITDIFKDRKKEKLSPKSP